MVAYNGNVPGKGVLQWIDEEVDRGDPDAGLFNPADMTDGAIYFQAEQQDGNTAAHTEPDGDVFVISPYRYDQNGDGNLDAADGVLRDRQADNEDPDDAFGVGATDGRMVSGRGRRTFHRSPSRS